MKKIMTLILCAGISISFSSYAEQNMSADEVKATFTGKTCDGYNENKGKAYQIYMADDGSMLHKNKKRTKEVKWEVTEDGQHCGIFKKRVCGHVVAKGEGVYHKVNDGEHTNTLKNCVDGNQL